MHPDWLKPQWDALWTAHRQQRLPHALMLSGPAGIGKEALASAFAQSLLCAEPGPTGSACGRCAACRLFQAGTHPDAVFVQPEEAGKSIKVEQVRELSAALTMTSHAGGRKVAVIAPADALNLNAANSLLKTLEEPTDNTHMLLVTAAPGRLPITVRSRCQAVKCTGPARANALAWLAGEVDAGMDAALLLDMADGAPLLARAMAVGDQIEDWQTFRTELAALSQGKADPTALATQWGQRDGLRYLCWARVQLTTAVRSACGGATRPPDWLGPNAQFDPRRAFELLDRLTFATAQWSSGLSTQLLLNDVLLAWTGVFTSVGARGAGGEPVRGIE